MQIPPALSFRRGYTVTPALLILNILVWVVMVVSGVDIMQPTGEHLIQWGANYGELTLTTQPWRMITACFLHIGIIHLLLNMYALYSLGMMLEQLMGSVRFALLYIVCGISGNALSLWWHDGMTLSAGASGAIFGLGGIFLALLTTNVVRPDARGPLLRSMLGFVGYNLLFGMIGGIDNAAHIGGLLGGMIGGYCVWYDLHQWRSKGKATFLGISAGLLVVIVASFFLYRLASTNFTKYEADTKAVETFETQAREKAYLVQQTLDPENQRKLLIESRALFDSSAVHYNRLPKSIRSKYPEVLPIWLSLNKRLITYELGESKGDSAELKRVEDSMRLIEKVLFQK